MASEHGMPLPDYLRTLGFNERSFHRDLQTRIKLGLPDFCLDYHTEVDEEKMSFLLYFERTVSGEGCRLQKFEAVYHLPINIQHQVIDGIDTAMLEDRMRDIDWKKFPWETVSIIEVRSVCNDLQRLSQAGGLGLKTQELLRIKYWSGTPFDTSKLDSERQHYRRTKTFEKNFPDIRSCYFLYFKLADTRTEILEQLSKMGFDLEVALDRQLQKCYPAHFYLEAYKSFEEGLMLYKLQFEFNAQQERYSMHGYEAALIRHQPIDHGVFSGIDTADLEISMAGIDWADETSHYCYDDGDPRFVPEIEAIISALQYKLPSDPKGKIIANMLQAKYWPPSPDFSGVMEESAWSYLAAQPAFKAVFHNEIHSSEAYNLLCGRAVCLLWGDPKMENSGLWLRLKSKAEPEQGYELVSLRGFNTQEIAQLVDHLPATTEDLYRVSNCLIHGDLASVKFLSGITIRVEADPEHGQLKLYTADMKPVSANIGLGPGGQLELRPRHELQRGKFPEQDKTEPKEFKLRKKRRRPRH